MFPERPRGEIPPLLLAEEAIVAAAGWRHPEYGDQWWPCRHPSVLFVMARTQLDQLAKILSDLTGKDMDDIEPRQLEGALQEKCLARGISWSYGLMYESMVLEEALELRRHLPGTLVADVGAAPDGSPTMTVGPTLPGLEHLGVEESVGEYLEQADSIYTTAREATRLAAVVFAEIEYQTGREEASDL